ncbi:MAG: TlpA disulfide reductase family protein [Desulfurivibrionaceae bacterium]|nr:TlpA disulfide reductase family protein [Desulfurivibrionaceae bacterium]
MLKVRKGKYSSWSIAVVLVLFAVAVGGGCSRDDNSSRGTEGGETASSLGGSGGTAARWGQPAPAFELEDIEGNIWRLSELAGQVVFINFWATWCPPCREEMPSMQELYETMPKDRFKMVTILSNDDPALAEVFAEKNGFEFPILIDPGSEAGKAYGITGVPETYIIDKEGLLRQKYLGPRQWNSPEAQKMLMDYINR